MAQISHDKTLENGKSYNYAKVTDNGALRVTTAEAGGGERDAFGRLRVSQVSTQLDIKQIHDNAPLFYDEETIGTGSRTYDSTTSSSLLETSADGDAVISQTFQTGNYQSGKGQQIFLTFARFDGETNVTKRVGYFNSNTTTPFNSDLDGIFLESTETAVTAYTYRNGTKTNQAVQTSFNIDKLDGTGEAPSVDWSKTQILLISFEWLGVGSVELSIVIDGIIYPFHKFKNANNLSNVYMQSPNHSARYSIRQSGAGSGSLRQICCTIGSEGSITEIGKILSENLGTAVVDANDILKTYALLSLALQDGKNDTEVDIVDFNILVSTSTNVLYKVLLNASVAGTFNYSAVANSSIKVAKGDTAGDPSTNEVTGGTLLSSGYVKSGAGAFSGGSAEAKIVNAIRLGMSIAGVSDTITLAVQPVDANADVSASISWRERS